MIQKTARNEYELGTIFPFNDFVSTLTLSKLMDIFVFIKGDPSLLFMSSHLKD